MRSLGVVLNAPRFDDAACVGETDEPVLVQALVAEFTVEAFDVRVLVGFAWANERQPHAAAIGPFVEYLAVEFGSVVDRDRLRQSACIRQAVEHPLYPQSGDRCVDLDGQAFPGAVVNDGQTAEAPSADEAVGNEVHRPAHVRGRRLGQRLALERANPFALAPPYGQASLAIEAVDALAIDLPTLRDADADTHAGSHIDA